jgi:transcriptional regulator with XRE-family HTH domain
MTTAKKLFEQLIRERKIRKVKQKDMAKHLNISPWTLNNYERGRRRISLDFAEKYADYLGYELKLMLK